MRQQVATSALSLPDASAGGTWAVVYSQCHAYFKHPVSNQTLIQLIDIIIIIPNYLDINPFY